MRPRPSSSSNMDNHVIHVEWIGTHVNVLAASNPHNIGIKGTIVDETRNTVTIQTEQDVKRVPKHGSVFYINGQEVNGDDVLVAPEERIKLKVKN